MKEGDIISLFSELMSENRLSILDYPNLDISHFCIIFAKKEREDESVFPHRNYS